MTDIQKFIPTGDFSIKSVAWMNNDKIAPHRKAKLLNSIRKLNVPRIKIFT